MSWNFAFTSAILDTSVALESAEASCFSVDLNLAISVDDVMSLPRKPME